MRWYYNKSADIQHFIVLVMNVEDNRDCNHDLPLQMNKYFQPQSTTRIPGCESCTKFVVLRWRKYSDLVVDSFYLLTESGLLSSTSI